MAQKFVDFLIEGNDKYRTASASGPEIYMKPCVSFGQDNGMTYCTVPATSTQGAIKAEDKAKQAQGGIQVCSLITNFFSNESAHQKNKAKKASVYCVYCCQNQTALKTNKNSYSALLLTAFPCGKQ